MSEIVITGLQELNTALAKLTDDVQKKYLRGAAGAGARVIRDATKRNIETLPAVVTGTLDRAVFSKWIAGASAPDRATFYISLLHGTKFKMKTKGKRTTKNRDAYYWWWIENGHIIAGAIGQKGRIKGGDRARAATRKTAKAVGHYVPPRPFLRPALEKNTTAAIEAVKAELIKRLGADYGMVAR